MLHGSALIPAVASHPKLCRLKCTNPTLQLAQPCGMSGNVPIKPPIPHIATLQAYSARRRNSQLDNSQNFIGNRVLTDVYYKIRGQIQLILQAESIRCSGKTKFRSRLQDVEQSPSIDIHPTPKAVSNKHQAVTASQGHTRPSNPREERLAKSPRRENRPL